MENRYTIILTYWVNSNSKVYNSSYGEAKWKKASCTADKHVATELSSPGSGRYWSRAYGGWIDPGQLELVGLCPLATGNLL